MLTKVVDNLYTFFHSLSQFTVPRIFSWMALKWHVTHNLYRHQNYWYKFLWKKVLIAIRRQTNCVFSYFYSIFLYVSPNKFVATPHWFFMSSVQVVQGPEWEDPLIRPVPRNQCSQPLCVSCFISRHHSRSKHVTVKFCSQVERLPFPLKKLAGGHVVLD